MAAMVGDGEMLMASGCASELVRMFEVNSVEGSREMEEGKDGFQVGVSVSTLPEGSGKAEARILELRCLHEIPYLERSAGLADQVTGFRHEMCRLCYTYPDPSSSVHCSVRAATDSITEKGTRPGLGYGP